MKYDMNWNKFCQNFSKTFQFITDNSCTGCMVIDNADINTAQKFIFQLVLVYQMSLTNKLSDTKNYELKVKIT